jgi:hypothetical protein
MSTLQVREGAMMCSLLLFNFMKPEVLGFLEMEDWEHIGYDSVYAFAVKRIETQDVLLS